MSSKHTPGTWAWSSDGCWVIATPFDQVLRIHRVFSVSPADRALIAAAPDLLEACEVLLAIVEDPGTYDAGKRLTDVLPAYNAARAAIKRARGEP